ncbi:TetR/AcrR family transcriptional regulator [Streptomyces mirabilis]|uniref:TetR/AcrR family transcriptional regulator n=1 Tax=Streptomyces mirabilis TaxID=68239 RepID=UPI0036A6693B
MGPRWSDPTSPTHGSSSTRRQILAESGDTSASFQAIAERADVSFGSFYNHFTSKAELFDAAVADALHEYGQAIDEHVHGIQDPAGGPHAPMSGDEAAADMAEMILCMLGLPREEAREVAWRPFPALD